MKSITKTVICLPLCLISSSLFAATINSRTEKTSPVAADELMIDDSANGYATRKIKAGNLPISNATQSALDGKAEVSCFASASAFNACFSLDWPTGFDVSGNYTVTGAWDFTGATVTGLPGTTYIAGTDIAISGGAISLSWDKDYADLINTPATTPLTAFMVTGVFPGTGDCLGSNGEKVDCGNSAGGIPHVASGYPSTSGAWNFNTTDYKLYTRLENGSVYSTAPLTSVATADVTPTGFAFTDVTDATISTEYTACDQVTGIDWPATVTASSNAVAICTGNNTGCGTFGTSPGTVANNGWVCARHTSSANNSTATNTPVTVGTVSDTFTSTTVAGGEPSVSMLTKLAHTTGTATASTTVSINVPTVYSGNLLTLSVVNDDGGDITTPSGWTLVESVVASSSRHSMFSKIASSEPASYSITNSVSGDLVAVMTSWQKPSGTTWSTITHGMIYRSTAAAATPYMTPTNGSVMYIGWPNDGGFSIVGGPYTGSLGTTPATNMVSIGRITASSLSIDTYYEPSNAGANVQRYVEFSAAEDSGVGFMVLSYE